MTASALASMLHARKIGKGRWMTRCPAHPDKKPSLAIAEGKQGILIRCMSHGCDTRDVLKALGLEWRDLFDGPRRMTPAIRARIGDAELKENLEHQLGLVIMLGVMDKEKIREWAAVERQIRLDIERVRCRIEPGKVYREWRERRWKLMNRTQRERHLEGVCLSPTMDRQ